MIPFLFNNLILELGIKYWISSKYLAYYSVLMDNQTWSLNTIPRLNSQFSVNKDCIHANVYLHLYVCTSKRRVSLLPKVCFFCILIQVKATVKTCSSSPKKEITFWYSWHVGGATLQGTKIKKMMFYLHWLSLDIPANFWFLLRFTFFFNR